MALVCADSGLVNLGKATPTNYQLIFPKIPTEESISAANPLLLNIFSTVIPSLSIVEEDLRWQGNRTKRALIPLVFEQWSVNFVVDSLFENWHIIFKWMEYINNNNDKIAEFHKNYSVDASLAITDNYRQGVLGIRFVSVWPTTLGEVNLSQREGDVQIESSIGFNYDYFVVEEPPTGSGDSGGGGGICPVPSQL